MATNSDFDQGEEPGRDADADAALVNRLKVIVGRLETEANDRVSKRRPMEQRWIEDLLQYHGRYDHQTESRLKSSQKSQLFINLTRQKTDALSARLMDLLFPTDDRNWGIQPTPVPRLNDEAEKAAQAARQIIEQAKEAQKQVAQAQADGGQADPAQMQRAEQLQQQADAAAAKAGELQSRIEQGRSRARLMEMEIDDQLKESHYHAVKRDQIEDACKLGTGVTKGPVTGDQVRKGWKKQPQTDEAGQPVTGPDGNPVMGDYTLEMSTGEQPVMRHVDIWSFFPDMNARTPEESEGFFERHLMNVKKLKKLARLPGFDKDAIRRLLAMKPRMAAPSYLADLRNINEQNQEAAKDLYHVWEYSGPLSADDMRDMAQAHGDEGTLGDLAEIDPLTELNAVIWFCQGEILKFSIYPYDSGECMYSVFCLIKDEASIFGYGLPAVIRDPQKSLNAGWRAMMDNAGYGSAPQIIVARDLIEPADGNYTLHGGKIWLSKEGLPRDHRAFDTFDIPMHQAEMANIIALSKQFIDDMSGMPAIAQGEQGVGITKTAQGMALLMNSSNVVFRRIVKNFDDDVTTPDIRRFYDWNMQFNPKPEIKGDYEVDARGSSVLLVRELQAQNLFLIAVQLGAHPVYGPMLRNRELLRKLFQAHMIPADEVVLTDDEIDVVLASAAADAENNQAEQAKAQLEMQRIDAEQANMAAQIEMANMENATRIHLAEIARETQLMKLAETLNMSIDKIEADLTKSREERASKERIAAAEFALTSKYGPSGGGYV
jgi:hypothetical protein